MRLIFASIIIGGALLVSPQQNVEYLFDMFFGNLYTFLTSTLHF